MFQGVMSNSTLSHELNNNLNNNNINFNPMLLQNTSNNNSNNNNNIISTQIEASLHKKVKKKRNLPGNPDPDAEVIALSPKSLLATNRFICEICNKGFQRDQNLQLHRRGHNLPWKLKQRNKLEIVRKKAYVCPEPSCVHHHPTRALGDLTGIKKHFCRKHGEKKFKCEKCSKIYAVHSDWKAHSKTCGTREYRCDCGTLFSRKDSFITHRAFCDALAEESARLSTNPFSNPIFPPPQQQPLPLPSPPPSFANQNPSHHLFPFPSSSSSPWDQPLQNPNNPNHNLIHVKSEINNNNHFSPQSFFQPPPPLFSKSMLTSPYTSDTNAITAHFLSATALLQKATAVGATLQQSQHSQQAPQTQIQIQIQTQTQNQNQNQQTMLNSFDELGATFHPITATTTTTTTNGYLPHYNNHQMGGMSFATWRKTDEVDTTRDFLGLNNNNNNNVIQDDDDDDDMEGNMLKFTQGGLHYGSGFDRDNSSPPSSSSSVLLKHHHQVQVLDHHNNNNNQGCFGNFVTNEQATAGASSESRWG